MDRSIETIRFDALVPYADAYVLQVERRNAVAAGTAPNALFLLEHRPVVTLGRRSSREHLLLTDAEFAARGIEVCESDRGGDVTYHGPGQLVAYPVLDLRQWRMSIQWYLRALEEVLIRLLGQYGIQGERSHGYTGVWVGGAKVAAIGVGIRDWVTFHGIALNIDPDMEHFLSIIPCGIADRPVTSLRQLLGKAPLLAEVMTAFDYEFRHLFGQDLFFERGSSSGPPPLKGDPLPDLPL